MLSIKRIIQSFLLKFRLIILQIPKTIQIGSFSTNDVSLLSQSLLIGIGNRKDIYESIRIVKPFTMLSYQNLATLYEQVSFCEKADIEGDFVECGVWKGGSVGLMALANLKEGKKRRQLHLFDAFDDICEPDPEKDGERAISEMKYLANRDRSSLKGKLIPVKGIYDSHGGHGTTEICKKLLIDIINYTEDNIHFHVGWFQDEIPKALNDIQKIAILRLDGDFYASTKFCIETLYDKVVSGGFIIIDDYGAYDGCKKAIDDFFESRNLSFFLNYSDMTGGECRYIQKP